MPLRLVTGEVPVETCSPQVELHARPGDRCESWPVEDPSVLHRLSEEASRAGLDTRLAGTLLVERSLLTEELAVTTDSGSCEWLDAAAEGTLIRSELTPASAAYFRALSRAPLTPTQPPGDCIQVPMRLSDRVLRVGIGRLLHQELLESAKAWERAAVIAGATMSEWALREATGRD